MEKLDKCTLVFWAVILAATVFFLSDLLLAVFSTLRNNGYAIVVSNYNGTSVTVQVMGYELAHVAALEVLAIAGTIILLCLCFLYVAYKMGEMKQSGDNRG